MKKTSILAFALLVTLLNVAPAQSNMLYASSDKPATHTAPAIEPVSKQIIQLDTKNQVLKLAMPLPAFTYSAVLLVKDFTGRTIKTIDVRNGRPDTFSVSSLLEGTYVYSLILDNQTSIDGQFTVRD